MCTTTSYFLKFKEAPNLFPLVKYVVWMFNLLFFSPIPLIPSSSFISCYGFPTCLLAPFSSLMVTNSTSLLWTYMSRAGPGKKSIHKEIPVELSSIIYHYGDVGASFIPQTWAVYLFYWVTTNKIQVQSTLHIFSPIPSPTLLTTNQPTLPAEIIRSQSEFFI